MLTREVIEDCGRFRDLREEWRTLLRNNASDCVFLTWEWLYTWWRYLAEDRKLLIITVRHSGRLVGVAPFAVRPSRWKRLLPFKAIEFLGAGYVGSDYLDLILHKGFEAEAMTEIAEELEHRCLLLQLSNITEAGSATSRLLDRLLARGWQHSAVPVDQCPYIDLRGETWDSYVSNLGKAHRYNVRRRLRKLHRNFHVDMQPAEDAGARHEGLKIMIDHHLKRWSERGGSSGFHTQALIDFHEAFTQTALERGWLRLFVLRLDGRPAAAFYCLSYRDKYYYYQTGFDMRFSDFSVGLAGIAMLIENAIAEGAHEFDFLHGGEAYKYLWTKTDRCILRYDLFLPYMSGRLHRQGLELRSDIKRVFNVCQRSILGG